MAGFLYFREGATTLPGGEIEKLQLRYAFTGAVTSGGVSGRSPSGKPGVVFGDPARHASKKVGYYPAEQTWRKLPNVEGRPECWVGFWNDAKPGPADLERQPMLAADVAVTLADGHKWLVPKVRQYDGTAGDWVCTLPSVYDVDDDGNLIPGKPLAKHAHLWDLTSPVAQATCFRDHEGQAPVTDRQMQDAAVALLQANYLVSTTELVAIESLATGPMIAAIVLAACRGDALMEWIDDIQKKSGPQLAVSGSSSTDGAAA